MSASPLVSVIMPVYNGERYLVEAIESILNQTFHDFEFIILNDGSTDGTEDILEPYLKNPKIHYHKFQQNQGYAKACNKAVDLARCRFITIQDADDISLPTRLEEEIEVLESNYEVELVYSPVLLIDVAGKILGQWGGKGQQLSKEEAFYELYLNGDFIPNPTVMMRRRHITHIFYDPSLPVCSDFEHQLRVAHDYPIFEISHPLVKLRRGRGHSSMTSHRELNFWAERRILKMIHQRYRRSYPKVTKVHYARAMSNQLLKESRYYASQGNVKKAIVLLALALTYNPFNLGIYGLIARKMLPDRLVSLLKRRR